MTVKIGIIGGPGTGKSTLARQLVQELSKDYIAEYVPEYASRYIKEYGEPQDLWEQVRIFNKQVEWENRIPDKVEYYVSDCPVILPFVYAIYMYDPFDSKSRLQFCDVFKMITKESVRYDYLFYLPPEIHPKDDGTRYHLTKESQEEVDRKILGALNVLNVPYETIDSVTLTARVEDCMHHINRATRMHSDEVDTMGGSLDIKGASSWSKELIDYSKSIKKNEDGSVENCECGGDECNCGQLSCGCYDECIGHPDRHEKHPKPLVEVCQEANEKWCDCDMFENQVCDICQGVTGNETDAMGGACDERN